MKLQKLRKLGEKPYLVALFICVALIKIPPFYFIPGIELSNSYVLIRLCLIFAFVSAVLIFRKREGVFQAPSLLLPLVFFYFFSQSMSVINASNIASFLGVYKDICMGLLLFLTMLVITRNDVIFLVGTFLISSLVGIAYQVLFIATPSLIEPIKPFLNTTYMRFVEYQTARKRYFGDTLDEALIPILFFHFTTSKKNSVRATMGVVFAVIIVIVILSSWKTKLIIALCAIIGSLFIFKQLRKYLAVSFMICVILFIVGNTISLGIVKYNVFDRILLDDNPTEVLIQNNRISYLKDAYRIGSEQFFFGAGLGNYYDNLSASSKRANQGPSSSGAGKNFIMIDDPHNIFFSVFAASGFIGLISIMSLLTYFAVTDLPLFRQQGWGKVLVITFWCYFIFSFLNPWMYFSFLMPFWFFRGAIENIKKTQYE